MVREHETGVRGDSERGQDLELAAIHDLVDGARDRVLQALRRVDVHAQLRHLAHEARVLLVRRALALVGVEAIHDEADKEVHDEKIRDDDEKYKE